MPDSSAEEVPLGVSASPLVAEAESEGKDEDADTDADADADEGGDDYAIELAYYTQTRSVQSTYSSD